MSCRTHRSSLGSPSCSARSPTASLIIEAAEAAVEGVRRLLSDLGMPQTLRDVGLGKDDIPWLVDELLTFQAFPIQLMNPRNVDRDDAIAIYTNAL